MDKKLPEFLYKYCSINQYLYESLLRNQLWFSSPNEFNDPFDCDIPWDTVYSLQMARNELKVFNSEIDQELSNKASEFDYFVENVRKFKNKEFVYSLSANEDNLLMWAHYADNHKGLILKFETQKLLTHHSQICKIQYVKNTEPIDLLKSPLDFFTNIHLQKSNDWKLENEYRIISEKNGYNDFPTNSLVSIKFGLRCSDNHKESVIELMNKLGQVHVTFFKSRPANNYYNLQSATYMINVQPINIANIKWGSSKNR